MPYRMWKVIGLIPVLRIWKIIFHQMQGILQSTDRVPLSTQEYKQEMTDLGQPVKILKSDLHVQGSIFHSDKE